MQQPVRAIAFKLGSVTLFVVMSSLIKASSGHVPPGESVFFRSFFALPVIIVWLMARGELAVGLRTADPLGHFWRGLVGTCAMGMMFAGLGLLPLPEVTAIGYAAPLLVVIFAAMFLGEEVRLFRLAAVGVGLAGVLIVLSPRLTAFTNHEMDAREALGAMVVLGGAVCAALAQVFVRKLVRTERTATIVFWFSVTATLLSLSTLPFGWVVPAPREAAFLVLAAGAQLLAGDHARRVGDHAQRHCQRAQAPFQPAEGLCRFQLERLVRHAPPLLAQRAPVGPRGVLHRDTVVIDQPIALGGGAAAPIHILGHADDQRPDIIEHRAGGQQVGGDGKPVFLDIEPLVEGEDGLECLRAGSGACAFVEHVDPPADHHIFGNRCLCRAQPTLRGYAIGIQKEQTGRGGFEHAPVARGGGAL